MSDSVSRWLQLHGFGRYAEAFAAKDIDAEVLGELTDSDLEKLGVTSVVSPQFVASQQAGKGSGARRASAGRAVAHSSSLNNAEGAFPSCPKGAPPMRHCGVAAARKSPTITSPLRLALTHWGRSEM